MFAKHAVHIYAAKQPHLIEEIFGQDRVNRFISQENKTLNCNTVSVKINFKRCKFNRIPQNERLSSISVYDELTLPIAKSTHKNIKFLS